MQADIAVQVRAASGLRGEGSRAAGCAGPTAFDDAAIELRPKRHYRNAV
jgi:hypothetical protein